MRSQRRFFRVEYGTTHKYELADFRCMVLFECVITHECVQMFPIPSCFIQIDDIGFLKRSQKQCFLFRLS